MSANLIHQKFYICEKCKNLVGLIEDAGEPLWCCNELMKELHAKTFESESSNPATQKHIPQVRCEGDRVSVDVGKVTHPMEIDHSIDWIYLQTSEGGHRKLTKGKDKPTAEFALTDNENPLAVFAYCSKHGLWKKELNG